MMGKLIDMTNPEILAKQMCQATQWEYYFPQLEVSCLYW